MSLYKIKGREVYCIENGVKLCDVVYDPELNSYVAWSGGNFVSGPHFYQAVSKFLNTYCSSYPYEMPWAKTKEEENLLRFFQTEMISREKANQQRQNDKYNIQNDRRRIPRTC